MRSSSIGANLPAGFATDDYDRLNQRIAAAMTTAHPAWHQWGASFNGVGYRLVAATRADARLPVTVSKSDRTRQELHIFSFVSAACSAVECFAYASCCVGSMFDSSAFPISTEPDRKNVTIKAVSRMFASKYGAAEPLHLFFQTLLVEPHWRELVDWRDIAIHRGAVPQAHFLSTAGVAPTSSIWRVEIHRGKSTPLIPSMTGDKLRWLVNQLNGGNRQLHDFLGRQGVP